MKTLKYFFFLVASLIVLSSCEDVIELDLATTDRQLVIEAQLDVDQQIATVILSQSNDFYDTTPPEKVGLALITLQNEMGSSYTLTETSIGNYHAENVIANPAEIFQIIIEVDGKSYEASGKVPHPITLLDIEQSESPNNPFGGSDEGSIMLSANWDDPAGTESYYRIRTYVNDSLQSGIYTVLNDEFFGDGEKQIIPIRQSFEENTSVKVELLSTDENYYDYFIQLSTVIGNGANSTTPFNPKSNFGNEVLGYFGIYYSSTLSVEL